MALPSGPESGLQLKHQATGMDQQKLVQLFTLLSYWKY